MSGTVIGIRFGVGSTETYNADDRRVDVSHKATYVVQMDSEAFREPDVLLVAGVPFINQVSPIYPLARCVNRSTKELESAIWEVEATFSNASKTEPDDQTPPQDRRPVWSWAAETLEEPLLTDARDETIAILNSAGEPLPPVTHPVAMGVLTIERYRLSWDYQEIFDYVNTLNKAAFWGHPANACLMAGIDAETERFEGGELVKVTYTIKFKKALSASSEPWKLKLLDEGTYYWSGGSKGSGQKTPFGDQALQQIIGNLDGSGGDNGTSSPAFVEYNRYEEKDWAPLDLGPNWP